MPESGGGLAGLLYRRFDGTTALWSDEEWDDLVTMVRDDGASEVDAKVIRDSLFRHAVVVGLSRSGVPCMTVTKALVLADRFGSPAGLVAATDRQLEEAIPGVGTACIQRIRGAFLVPRGRQNGRG
jgi:hypothetical protein